ncbi:MAG: FAD-dependent oxidoreductase, partial [Anaerolineae bacterium]|nr:FAD-dependent oxidoreductase [Anaerolineae bacterium]
MFHERFIPEPPRQVPIVAEADVVVCGGGPGGVPAAIAAARHGAKVILIERYGFMGGLATAGLVAPILAHKAHEADFAIVEGILREITERMHALGGAPTWQEALKAWGIYFDAECLKIVLDEMCQEAGVELMLHSYIADVAMRDGQIAAVLVENKSGRQAVAGKVFVDATGDADVAFRAGAATTHGRAWDGRPEAMGSFVHLAGFTYPDAARSKELTDLIQKEMAAGRLSFYNPYFLNQNSYHRDHTSANLTRFAGDPTSAADMTRAE